MLNEVMEVLFATGAILAAGVVATTLKRMLVVAIASRTYTKSALEKYFL